MTFDHFVRVLLYNDRIQLGIVTDIALDELSYLIQLIHTNKIERMTADKPLIEIDVLRRIFLYCLIGMNLLTSYLMHWSILYKSMTRRQ